MRIGLYMLTLEPRWVETGVYDGLLVVGTGGRPEGMCPFGVPVSRTDCVRNVGLSCCAEALIGGAPCAALEVRAVTFDALGC